MIPRAFRRRVVQLRQNASVLMHQSLARCSAPVSLVHAPSWADFITAMVGFKVFGTHKSPWHSSGTLGEFAWNQIAEEIVAFANTLGGVRRTRRVARSSS